MELDTLIFKLKSGIRRLSDSTDIVFFSTFRKFIATRPETSI